MGRTFALPGGTVTLLGANIGEVYPEDLQSLMSGLQTSFNSLLLPAVTLTAGASIPALSPPGSGGLTLITLPLVQDGIGFHNPTWDPSFLGISRFMPRQGPGQASSATFLYSGNGQFTLVGFDGIDLTQPLSVQDFGAKGDGITYDRVSCQAAINEAQTLANRTFGGVSTGATVYFPDGKYRTDMPLTVRGSRVHIKGDRRYASTILPDGNIFQGAGLHIMPAKTGIPTTPALVGSGLCWDGVTNPQWFIDLRECSYVWLDGLSTFTWQNFVKVPAGTTSGVITSCRGTISSEDASDATFAIYINQTAGDATGYLHVFANISGTLQSVSTPAGSLPFGSTVYHVAVTYDGTNLKVWIGGQLKATLNAPGTLTQRTLTHWTVGVDNSAFPRSNPINYCFCYIDSVEVANAVYYTTNFTPPTGKHVRTGNTLILVNFDQNTDNFVVGVTQGAALVYMTIRTSNYDEASAYVTVEDLDVWGGSTAIQVYETRDFSARRLGFQLCRYALMMENNCFTSRIDDVEMTVNGSHAVLGIGVIGQGGLVPINGVQITSNGSCIWISDGSAVVTQPYLLAEAVCVGVGAGAVVTIIEPALNEEGLSPTPAELQGMLLVDGSQVQVIGGIITPTGIAVPPVLLSGDSEVTLIGTQLDAAPAGASGYVFKHINGAFSLAGKQNRVELINCPLTANAQATPLCNIPGLVLVSKNGSRTNQSGLSTTDTAAKNLAGTCTYTSTGGGPSFTFNLPNAELDASFQLLFTPKSSTGTPAANSNRVKSYTTGTTTQTVVLEADPGAGNSVTFSWLLVRA